MPPIAALNRKIRWEEFKKECDIPHKMNVFFLHKLTWAMKPSGWYRAEKSTDALISDYANFSHLTNQYLSRKNDLRLNALSCIIKQGDVIVVKSVIFTFVELLHHRAQCSKFFIPLQQQQKNFKYLLQEFATIPFETVKINPQGFSTIYVSSG